MSSFLVSTLDLAGLKFLQAQVLDIEFAQFVVELQTLWRVPVQTFEIKYTIIYNSPSNSGK